MSSTQPLHSVPLATATDPHKTYDLVHGVILPAEGQTCFLLLGGAPQRSAAPSKATVQHPSVHGMFPTDRIAYTEATLGATHLDLRSAQRTLLQDTAPTPMPAHTNPLRFPSRSSVRSKRRCALPILQRARQMLDAHSTLHSDEQWHVLARHETHAPEDTRVGVTTLRDDVHQKHPECVQITPLDSHPMGCSVVPGHTMRLRKGADPQMALLHMHHECRDLVHGLLEVRQKRLASGLDTTEVDRLMCVAIGGEVFGGHAASRIHTELAAEDELTESHDFMDSKRVVSDTLLMRMGDKAELTRSGIQVPSTIYLLTPSQARDAKQHPGRFRDMAVQFTSKLHHASGKAVPMRAICHKLGEHKVADVAAACARSFRPLDDTSKPSVACGRSFTVPIHALHATPAGSESAWAVSSAGDYTAAISPQGDLHLQVDAANGKVLARDTEKSLDWQRDFVAAEARLASKHRDARSAGFVQMSLKVPDYWDLEPGRRTGKEAAQAHERFTRNRCHVLKLADTVASRMGAATSESVAVSGDRLDAVARALSGRPTEGHEDLVERVRNGTPGEKLVCRTTAAALEELGKVQQLLNEERPSDTQALSARIFPSRICGERDGIVEPRQVMCLAAGTEGKCTGDTAVVAVWHKDPARGNRSDISVLLPSRGQAVDSAWRSKSVDMDTPALRASSSVAAALGQTYNRNFQLGYMRQVKVAGAGPVDTASMGVVDTKQFTRFAVGWKASPEEHNWRESEFEVCTASSLRSESVVPIARTVTDTDAGGRVYTKHNRNWKLRSVGL